MNVDLVKWNSGDWYALYVDGVLTADGHSITGEQMLQALGIEYAPLYIPSDEDTDWGFCRVKSLDVLKKMLAEESR